MSRKVFIARQPILDREHKTFGYELLYRDGGEAAPSLDDPDEATRSVLSRAVLDFGLADLIGDRFGFVNATPHFVTEGLHRVLPPDGIVLEVREPEGGDLTAITAIADARSEGYHFALDNVTDLDCLTHSRLLDIVSLVKVEVSSISLGEVAVLAGWVRRRRPEVLLVAEKVENAQQYLRAKAAGFDLFEGYYFERPEVLEHSQTPGDAASAIHLVAELQRDQIDIGRVEELVGADPVLSYRLLAAANSSAYGVARRIESVHHAIVLLGVAQVRQLAALLAVAHAGEERAELAVTGAVRARVMSALAVDSGRGEAAFTVGLLSVADGLFGMPMEQLLAEVPVSDDIRAALLEGDGPLADGLAIARASEHADLAELRRLAPGRSGEVQQVYRAGLEWADSMLRNVGAGPSKLSLAARESSQGDHSSLPRAGAVSA